MSVVFSAPAKIILLGEYAVLEGAPALVSAVDRRARVAVSPAEGPHWVLHAPDIGLDDYPLAPAGEVPETTSPEVRARLAVYEAVHRVLAKAMVLPGPCRIAIDTSAFVSGGRKLGLGSSAAVAVALTAALARFSGQGATPDDIFAWASQAHRMAQGGIGSNTDVAAAVYGGIQDYRMGQPGRARALPTRFWLRPVLLNEAASTPGLVRRVQALGERRPAEYAAKMERLKQLAGQGLQAFDVDDARLFIPVVNAYHQAMAALGEAAGADIVSPAHRQLHGLASRQGLAYKPCGAGGGDLGMMVGPASTAPDRIIQAFQAAGFELLDAALGAEGIRQECN